MGVEKHARSSASSTSLNNKIRDSKKCGTVRRVHATCWFGKMRHHRADRLEREHLLAREIIPELVVQNSSTGGVRVDLVDVVPAMEGVILPGVGALKLPAFKCLSAHNEDPLRSMTSGRRVEKPPSSGRVSSPFAAICRSCHCRRPSVAG